MKLLISIAAIGAMLRIRQFHAARSMWLDEIALAVSLRDIGFPEILTSPLLDGQSASPGYLVASKASVRIFGTDEYGLRLVALVSGIATVVLAVLIAQRLLTRRWAQVGFVSLIAFSPVLIYYSNEVKQYSTDVMATSAVLVLWSLRRHHLAPWILGLSGAAIALISLPGVIALAALGIALLIERLTATPPNAPTGIWMRLRDLVAIAALWSIGMGFHLFYSFGVGTDRKFMRTWWGERRAFPPGIAGDLWWYPQWLARLGWVGIGHADRVGSVTPITATVVTVMLVAMMAVLAVVALRRAGHLRWVLGLAILIALVIGQIQIYPTSGRLSLYLVPVVLLMFAVGAESAVRWPVRIFGGVSLIAMLLVQLSITVPTAITPLNDRDMKSLVAQVELNAQRGDTLIFEAQSTLMRWYVDPDLVEALEFDILRAGTVADTGVPADRYIWSFNRLWIASTHGIGEAVRLANEIATQHGFTQICEYTPADETYLTLLIRDDLIAGRDLTVDC